MSIYVKDREIDGAYFGKRVISAIYKGGRIIWEASIRLWKGKRVWKNKAKWKY